ncbi:hypothetical protein [Frankia sp. Cppng1_Ct_nod]|uniref:hypothetical protein n=1 Tax=Frankia sp. Cppng1_Ct_nod TaxID=2897162 RepID=UPI00104146FD|nr:hypothetical protein [Frankia sp. Cppng1_Ct_nod]
MNMVTGRPPHLASADVRTGPVGPVGPATRAAWRTGLVRWLVPRAGDPANAIYGTILVTAIIAAEDPDQIHISDIIVTVAVTVIVFWLSHGYADLIGDRLNAGTRPSLREVNRSLARNWPIVQAAVVPTAALIIAAVAGATVENAQAAALWTSTALLAVWGIVAGRACRLHGWGLALHAGGSALLGLVMIFLKVLIH